MTDHENATVQIEQIIASTVERLKGLVLPQMAELSQEPFQPTTLVGVGGRNMNDFVFETERIPAVRSSLGRRCGYTLDNAIIMSPEGIFTCQEEFLHRAIEGRWGPILSLPYWPNRRPLTDSEWLNHASKVGQLLDWWRTDVKRVRT